MFDELGRFYTSNNKLIKVFKFKLNNYNEYGCFKDEPLYIITSNDYVRYGNKIQTLSIIKTYQVKFEQNENRNNLIVTVERS